MRAAGRGTSRIMLRQVVLLPEPESPTRPRVSHADTPNDTPSTAMMVPHRVTRCVRRSRTSTTGPGEGAAAAPPGKLPSGLAPEPPTGSRLTEPSELAELRIEGVAQPVPEQVEGEHHLRSEA